MAEITIEKKGFERAMLMLGHMPDELENADKAATSRALSSARAQAVLSARNTYDVKAAELRASIRVSAGLGEMTSQGRPLALMRFKVSPRSPQRATVKASVKKASREIGHAFVAEMKNGYIGVYKRTGNSRYPIEQLYSVSSAQMVGEPTVIEATAKKATETYEARIQHEVNRIISRH